MVKLLKISAVAMLLSITAFSAQAKDHSKGFDCKKCTEDACGKKDAAVEMLKSCGDCPGTEVFDCGIAVFGAQNCQKVKGKEFSSQCKQAAKMMSKAAFQAHLKAVEGNADAQAIIDGFKKLDEANLGESKDKSEQLILS